MDMNKILADELDVRYQQVEAAVKLIDEGNTIPFISRYRKEATGSLNDEILRNLYDRLTYLDVLNQGLQVMDSTAASLCMDNRIPICVFSIEEPENIKRAICGEHIGTIIKEDLR